MIFERWVFLVAWLTAQVSHGHAESICRPSKPECAIVMKQWQELEDSTFITGIGRGNASTKMNSEIEQLQKYDQEAKMMKDRFDVILLMYKRRNELMLKIIERFDEPIRSEIKRIELCIMNGDANADLTALQIKANPYTVCNDLHFFESQAR